jgi:hypothetical protein
MVSSAVSNYDFNQARIDCRLLSNGTNMSDLAVLYDPVNHDLLYPSKLSTSTDCNMIGLRQNDTNFEPDFNWTWIDGTPLGNTVYGFVDFEDFNPEDLTPPENCGGLWPGQGIADYPCGGQTCVKFCSIPSEANFF